MGDLIETQWNNEREHVLKEFVGGLLQAGAGDTGDSATCSTGQLKIRTYVEGR